MFFERQEWYDTEEEARQHVKDIEVVFKGN